MENYLFNRRHPEYRKQEAIWQRSLAAYRGGDEYLDLALIRHVSEIDLEFAERRKRAYYFNYPRAVAQRITQYVFAVEPRRLGGSPELEEDFDRAGHRVSEVMRQLSTLLNIFGRCYLWVDCPAFEGSPDLAESASRQLRPYARALSPLQVTDWSYAPDGRLEWAVIQEKHLYSPDPRTPESESVLLYCYTRKHWEVWQKTRSSAPQLLRQGENRLKEVPLLEVLESDGVGIGGAHWFADVVRVSEAILNNESEAQMNVVKQMFGMLVVSDAFFRGVESAAKNAGNSSVLSATVARSAAIIESPEEKGISRYISPGGVPSEVIRQENESLKRELYEVVGLAVQNHSRAAQSAESKQWDFQNICQFLTGRAALLEQLELAAWQLFNRFDPAIAVPQITYNRKFAVRDLAGAISGLVQLASLSGAQGYQAKVEDLAQELLDSLGSAQNTV